MSPAELTFWKVRQMRHSLVWRDWNGNDCFHNTQLAIRSDVLSWANTPLWYIESLHEDDTIRKIGRKTNKNKPNSGPTKWPHQITEISIIFIDLCVCILSWTRTGALWFKLPAYFIYEYSTPISGDVRNIRYKKALEILLSDHIEMIKLCVHPPPTNKNKITLYVKELTQRLTLFAKQLKIFIIC